MLKFSVKLLQNLDWSIRYKLGLTFAFLLFCFVLNGFVSIFLLLNIQTIEQEQKRNTAYLERLQYNELIFNSKTSLYQNAIFITKSPAVLDDFRLTFDFSDPDPAYQEFEKNFSRLYSSAFNNYLRLNTLIQQLEFDQAAERWRESTPVFQKITDLINNRKQYLHTALNNEERALSDTIVLSISLIVFVTLLSILLSVFLLFLLNHLFVNPINHLQLGLQKVAEGELDQRVEIANRDEVGKLAFSFDSAIQALQRVLQSVQIGASLSSVASELSGASQQQASYANQQAVAIKQLIAVLQELGRTASQIAESATHVSQKTELTLEQIDLVEKAGTNSQYRSQQLADVITTTLTGIEKVSAQVELISQKMLNLDEQSQAISRVVELLNAISDSVHLLSLNAAIEAAGAGVYGERFAVVAKEIRALAQRSRVATKEAGQLITEVQSSSREVVVQIVAGQSEVQNVLQANSQLRQGLQDMENSSYQVSLAVVKLVELAGDVNKEAEMISQATYQQHISNQQIIDTAYSVNDIVQETVLVTENVANNSSQLEDMALQLNKTLKQVKLVSI